MIKYLQSMKKKKGFTMAELIIVIAIIGVLTAMILPIFSSNDTEVQAANVYASDFFASLQYNFTRYQTTEHHVTPGMANATEQTYMAYDNTKTGNYLKASHIFIEAYYENGLRYVKVGSTLRDVLQSPDTTSNTELERLLQQDLSDTIEQAGTGYYYAVVNYNVYGSSLPVTLSTPTGDKTVSFDYGNIKVLSTHYCRQPVSQSSSLVFADYNLMDGMIVGTCSSSKESANCYVGAPTSHFLNVSSVDATVTIT